MSGFGKTFSDETFSDALDFRYSREYKIKKGAFRHNWGVLNLISWTSPASICDRLSVLLYGIAFCNDGRWTFTVEIWKLQMFPIRTIDIYSWLWSSWKSPL